jgi:hypothetical protein
MFGHGLPLGVVDFCGGVVVVEPDAAGALVCVPLVLVVDVAAGAAEALAMPAAAPPVARAPAIMVAPSILEMVIGSDLLGRWMGCAAIVRARRKRERSSA